MTIRTRRNLARLLRRNATDAERKLWRQLRARLPLEGTYFRRQVPIDPFIADFACFRHRLVIELDGDHHGVGAAPDRDAERTRTLERHGFRVLRFWSHQVLTAGDAVLETIQAALQARVSVPDQPDRPDAADQGLSA